MKNNTTQKGASAPSAAEIAAVVAAYQQKSFLFTSGVLFYSAA